MLELKKMNFSTCPSSMLSTQSPNNCKFSIVFHLNEIDEMQYFVYCKINNWLKLMKFKTNRTSFGIKSELIGQEIDSIRL